jgi:hypothetical protein
MHRIHFLAILAQPSALLAEGVPNLHLTDVPVLLLLLLFRCCCLRVQVPTTQPTALACQ